MEHTYVCRRCAQRGGTCCRLGADKGADCFPLSLCETERINAAVTAASYAKPTGSAVLPAQAAAAFDAPTGQKAFSVPEGNSEPFLAAMRNLFPKDKKLVDTVFPPGNTHSRLGLTAEGACVFLAENGCTLPQKSRPWFCLMFPFWVVDGQLQCFADKECLAVRENRSFTDLTGAFDVSRDEIMERYHNLRRDWGLESIT